MRLEQKNPANVDQSGRDVTPDRPAGSERAPVQALRARVRLEHDVLHARTCRRAESFSRNRFNSRV